MKKYFFYLTAFLMCTSLFAEKLSFKYEKNESYKILSTIEENSYVNGEFDHHAEIINRISVNITDVTPEGNGVLDASFMTSEKSNGGKLTSVYSWGEEYQSHYTQKKSGEYDITDAYFMPTVRSVPTFPDKEIEVGETWQARGHEAHDFRNIFGIEKPYRVPFNVNYQYLGKETIDGKELHVIKASYSNFFNSPQIQNRQDNIDYPKNILGVSEMTIYFDNEKGMINSYNEKFKITLVTESGTKFVFSGTANAVSTYTEKIKNEETLEKVQTQIAEMGIENTDVKTNEKGITISLENIQFKPNSAELMESEKIKLQKISKILESFPNNDLLVTGHTALSGSLESCQTLSEERANAVVEYLISIGTKKEHQIFPQGKGASEPIAPNSNSAGMAKNRRVEITIME